MTPAVVPVGPGLDPVAALAMGMVAGPGVYAVLLGSGVSTSAGVPTGWGVMADLASRLAVARRVAEHSTAGTRAAQQALDVLRAEVADDPEAWWVANTGLPFRYDTVLEQSAPSSAARRDLLAGYFEPTPAEKEQGLKVPTPAHRAVARLVAGGWVKVVLTTNFDRLLEVALDEVGVVPQVASTPAGLAGLQPTAHVRATVIKLHGDYMSPSLLNTADELAEYPTELATYLGRVLDDHGLLVAGWSAEWDVALAEAVRRAGRRYPTYWTARTTPLQGRARTLADHRAAPVIPVRDADTFFTGLADQVEAIGSLPELPATRAADVAQLKRNLAAPARSIRLHDQVLARTDTVTALAASLPIDRGTAGTVATYMEVLEQLDGATDTLLHLLAVGVFHGDRRTSGLWVRVLQRLTDADLRLPSGLAQPLWANQRLYPAMTALWTAGVAATARGDYRTLADLLLAPVTLGGSASSRHISEETAVVRLGLVENVINGDLLNQAERWPNRSATPVSRMLREVCEAPLREVLSPAEYGKAFDRFDALRSVVEWDCNVHGIYEHHGTSGGAYAAAYNHSSGPSPAEKALAVELAEQQQDWPVLKGGLFGGVPGRAETALTAVEAFWKRNFGRACG